MDRVKLLIAVEKCDTVKQRFIVTGLENLVITPKPEWLLQLDVSE
jgi:hypothetical protein